MMTMDDFEFGVPTEEMAALPEGFPEAGLDVPGPAEDGADALIPQPPEDGDGQGGVEAAPSPEEPPKKKRASRKKANKPEEPPAEDAAGPVEDGGTPSMAEDTAPVERLPEADQLDPEAGNSSSDTLDVMGLAAQEDAAPMDEPPVGDNEPARQSAPSGPNGQLPGPRPGGRRKATALSCR